MYEFLEKVSMYASMKGVPEYLVAIIIVLIIVLCVNCVLLHLRNKKLAKANDRFDRLNLEFLRLSVEHEELVVSFRDEEEKNVKALAICSNVYSILEKSVDGIGELLDKK